MKQYDELTGCWIDDESNSDDSKNIPPVATDTSTTEEKKKENPDTLLGIEEKNPLNRKLIFIVCGIVVFIVLIYTYFIPKISKNNEKKNKVKTASDIEVPFFGSYYDSGIPENRTIEEINSNDKTNISNSTPNNTHTAVKKSYTKKYTTNTTQAKTIDTKVFSEEDLKAINASYDDCKMAKLYPEEENISTNTAVQNVQTTSEYVQDRLSKYAGLNGQTSNQQNMQTTYESQNNQSDKQKFYSSDSTTGGNGNYLNNFTLWKGTIIPAILITSINTDIPGMIKAQVTENIYDSKTGKKLLIPQGSFLIAEYSSSISYNQNRIQIAWNTLTRPDGYQINLGNMPATDSKGMSGVKGTSSNHFFEYVKAMGIITFFTAINGEFNNSINSTDNQSVQNLLAANQNTTTELGAKLIDKALDIQPTLKKINGKSIKIFTNRNIFLPPLESYKVTKKYINE